MILKNIRKKAGFTLVELLVVVAIIGILAGILTLNLVGSGADARDGRRISDISSMEGTLESYFADNKAYPTATGCEATICTDYSTGANFLSGLVTGDYLKDFPRDPINDSDFRYSYSNPATAFVPDTSKYVITAALEDKTSGENVFRYCNAGTWGDYYYLRFSSYSYRTTYTNENDANCDICDGVTCYSKQW